MRTRVQLHRIHEIHSRNGSVYHTTALEKKEREKQEIPRVCWLDRLTIIMGSEFKWKNWLQ